MPLSFYITLKRPGLSCVIVLKVLHLKILFGEHSSESFDCAHLINYLTSRKVVNTDLHNHNFEDHRGISQLATLI